MILRTYRALFYQLRSLWNDPYGRFLRDGGDELLLANLELNKNCWSIDFGGFHGDWTASVVNRYQTNCLVVEPVPSFANHIAERFASFSDIHVFPFLVGRSEGTRVLHLAADATGSSASGLPIVVKQVPLSKLLSMTGRDPVGVTSMNIEGSEYELIEILLESGEISRFKTFLIQFHKTDSYSPERYLRLQLRLAESHNLTWDYPFVWQRWDRK